MDNPWNALLEKIRLPQPSFQRFAVVSLFRRLESTSGALGPTSAAFSDAISQCLRSPSAAVVDQAVRELCRLVSFGNRFHASAALIELQSALEGCDPRFVAVFVKGIGFICRLVFRTDSSWGRRFDRFELHPFVKALSCCENAQEELIEQVLLFVDHNKSLGIDEVAQFLHPFFIFSMVWKTSGPPHLFSRNLISATASLSCTFPSEAISILKLLAECLKYLPLTNEEEFLYIVTCAVPIVDAYVVVLQQIANIEKEMISDARNYSVEVLNMLLSICAYFHRKLLGQVGAVIDISRHLLAAQKEIGLRYAYEYANIVASASVILAQAEFEHDQLSVLKLLILLMEWKAEELNTKTASCFLNEELLIVFPAINLLSSPSKSVKAAVAHLLSLAEGFILNFMDILKEKEASCSGFPVLIDVESIPLRLLHHFFLQGQKSMYRSYFFLFNSDKFSCAEEIHHESFYLTPWLREHLLPIERVKASLPPQASENYFEGVNLLLGSIASSLVIHPDFNTSAVDFLVAVGLQDPKLGMAIFQAALFFIHILIKFESNSSKILLSLLEVLPSLASHSAMVQIIVQSVLPMLHKDAKPSLHAMAIRLLCKTWTFSDRVFENLQDVLSSKMLLNFKSVRVICISIAASVRDVCRHNPDRGVDLILSVSSCIESDDSTVKALGLQSLSFLCEADVVDFYTAWEVIAKHVENYAEEPIVATGLVTLLRWGALDVEAYHDIAKSILLILWEIGTLRICSSESLWVKARAFAFKSMMHFEMVNFQEFIPEFNEKNMQCLLDEDNAEVLEAMEEFEIKIINYEHINRRRALKERKPLRYKVENLLEMLPQALFSSGTGNININARDFPGAALLTCVFTPKEHKGANAVPRIHTAFEKALLEIAESLPLSRNIFIALLAIESWKAFIQQWMNALAISVESEDLKSVFDILKICIKVAEESVPQVSINAALAICALCLVVPSSSYAIISCASEFFLKWLAEYEHEHHQWPSAISLGLISNRFHATDRMQKIDVITCLLKVACKSKIHLVIGACGLGLGFASQGLLSTVEDDSYRLTEESLLFEVFNTLIVLLRQTCPLSYNSLESLNESFRRYGYENVEASSRLIHCKLDKLDEEDDPWGVAGLVLGLGNCVPALYGLGVYDAVVIIKDILLSWISSPKTSNRISLVRDGLIEIPLAIGACLAIPIVVLFFQSFELAIGDIGAILIRYVSLLSELLNSKEYGIHYQNLVMASCIGAGSFVSCVLSDGEHSIRYDDIKQLLEMLRSCYSKSSLPLVQLGAMIGIVNAFGAAAGDLNYKSVPSSLPVDLDRKGSDLVRGPIILSHICENLSTSAVQQLFLVAKEAKDPQARKYAAWALSFLRQRWRSEKIQETDYSKSVSVVSNLQNVAEDSLVWKLCMWLTNINFHQVHSRTVITVLRCLSKAPRLPALDWASIIRNFMKNAANFVNTSQKLQDAASFREECVKFSLSRANDIKSLIPFLDSFADISRFRTVELNLQCLILSRAPDLLNTFSTSRIEKLFRDFTQFFSLSSSPYFIYELEKQVLLRISFWKGVYGCLNGAYSESSYASEIEKCMESLFCLLPTLAYDVKSDELRSMCSEWSEAVRCLARARQGWLLCVLQFSGGSTLNEIATRIFAKVKLVKIVGLSFSDLENLKSYILNSRLEGTWWSVLVELVNALSIADVSIKRQWLFDALDVSCVTEHPSTAISFIGLLSGSCSKYTPLLIVEPETVLADLPMNLPSLLSNSSWTSTAELCVEKLLTSTDRICAWAALLHGSSVDGFSNPNHIEESDVRSSIILAQSMHRTCLSLKDYLPVDRRLRLAGIEVPGLFSPMS